MKFTRAHSTAVTNSQTLQIQFQTHDPQKFPHAYLLSLPSPGRFPGHCYLLCPYTFASLEVSHNHSTQSCGRAGAHVSGAGCRRPPPHWVGLPRSRQPSRPFVWAVLSKAALHFRVREHSSHRFRGWHCACRLSVCLTLKEPPSCSPNVPSKTVFNGGEKLRVRDRERLGARGWSDRMGGRGGLWVCRCRLRWSHWPSGRSYAPASGGVGLERGGRGPGAPWWPGQKWLRGRGGSLLGSVGPRRGSPDLWSSPSLAADSPAVARLPFGARGKSGPAGFGVAAESGQIGP